MIELTEQQLQALERPEATPPLVLNPRSKTNVSLVRGDVRQPVARRTSPRTRETFVLLRVDEYERLKEDEYDDSPWTREELHALAWEAGKPLGWEDMDEYDDAPEKP